MIGTSYLNAVGGMAKSQCNKPKSESSKSSFWKEEFEIEKANNIMYKFLTKNGLLVALGVGVAVIIVHFASVFAGLEAFNQIPDDLESKPELLMEGAKLVGPGIVLTAILFVIAAIAMVGFGIFQVATNPKGAIKGIAGLALIAVIFGIGWAMSGNEVLEVWDTKGFGITPTISKYVGASVFVSIALLVLAAVGLVLSEIRNFFK